MAAVVLFLLLLPVGVKYYLTDWLVKNGADSATVEKLSYNPFAGRVTLEGVDVLVGGQSFLRNSSMVVDVGIISLLSKDIRVQKAVHRDLILDLEQYEDGRWRFGSYTMQGNSTEKIIDSKEEVASTWGFLADSIVLDNCSVHLKMVDLEMTLVVDKAELNKFTTRNDKTEGNFSLKGQLNGGPLDIQLDTLQIVPDVLIGGNVAISKFNLKELSRLLGDVLPTFVGEVGIDGKVFFSMVKEKGMEIDYDGLLNVAGPDIGNSGFSTKAESLKWQGRVQYSGPDNGPIGIETNGLLAAAKFAMVVPGAELSMEEPRIDLSGKTTVTIAGNVVVENDGALLVEGVQLQLPPYEVSEESLLWKGKVLYDSDHKGKGQFVRTEGALDLGPFQVEGGEQESSFTTGGDIVSWQGALTFSHKESGKQPFLELKGDLSGSELRATLVEPAMRLGQGKVELKLNSTIGFSEVMDITGNSGFTLEQFKLFQGDGGSPFVSFDKLVVTELEGRGGRKVAIKELLAAGLKVSVAGNLPLDVNIPEILLGDVYSEDLATFGAGELKLKSPLITAVHNNQELIRFGELAVKDITVGDGTQGRAESVSLVNLAFLGSQESKVNKTALSFAGAELSDISWSNEAGLQADTLLFDDLVATLIRDKEGVLNIIRQLGAMQQAGADSKTDPAPEVAEGKASGGAPFRVREIAVGGKSVVFFEDYTLAVPYVTDLAISELKISDLDSSNPEKATNILLKGDLEKRAPLEITGQLSPFKEKPAMEMKLKLKNYPLSSLSAYTVQSVGTALASGQLRLKMKVSLADDELDMKNSLLLKKLETKTISPELAEELDNQLPVSLDSALSLLRDSDENISLEIPISGQLSELDVGIGDVLITALSKAVVPATSGYLMYALGPYGALAYVGMKVGEKMMEIKLPPVVFDAQESALTEEHTKYLERVGKILQDYPESDFQLCPRVASWEFLSEKERAAIAGDSIKVAEENRDALLELGQKRAMAVQSYLADSYSIAHDRLLICKTIIEEKKDAVPAVLPQH